MTAEPRYSVLFLGHLFPKHLESVILDQPLPPVQTQRFGEALLKALVAGFGGNVEAMSVASLLDYPKCKLPIAPRAKWYFADSVCVTMVPFINIIGLKHLTRFLATFFFTLWWAIRNRSSNRVIIMHGVQSCKLWGALLACTLAPSITIPFLTDDVGIPLKWESAWIRKIRKLDVFLIKAALQYVSGVIAMTPQLASKLTPGKLSLIIPAIHNPSVVQVNQFRKRDRNTFSIGYFGTLNRDYGIELLLSAFKLANRDKWKLVIAGAGDLQEEIRCMATTDRRVMYLGFLSLDEMVQAYQVVDVLVNPRRTSVPIASLAFPSKLVEYLGTGKPVITTDLSTLDKDFRDHLIVMQTDTPEELIRCLDEVASWTDEQLESWRDKTMAFVRNELSPSTQGKKIRRFVDSLSIDRPCA